MGMSQDLAQCKTHARVDDVPHRTSIAAARESIYEKNNAVDSVGVERILKEKSLVPTTVFVIYSLVRHL
jgi:hypothetical protein